MSDGRSFQREFAALPDIFAFTAAAYERHRLAPELRPSVDLVIEELFTNMVKYGAGTGPVSIAITSVPAGVEVTMIEPDADYFDVTAAPPVDIARPAAEREPGKLGLHLIPRFVDAIDYGYSPAERIGRITFRKSAGDGPAGSRTPC
jgi:serine/threonine-protein kinase RsbW